MHTRFVLGTIYAYVHTWQKTFPQRFVPDFTVLCLPDFVCVKPKVYFKKSKYGWERVRPGKTVECKVVLHFEENEKKLGETCSDVNQ